MSAPYDNVVAYLNAFSAAIQEDYADDYFKPTYHMGLASRELLALESEKVVGDGKNMQALRYLSAPVQASMTPLSDFPHSQAHQFENVKVRFHQKTAASNDFGKLHGVIEVTQFDIDNKDQGAACDLVEQHMTQLRDNFVRASTLLDNVGRSCVLAYVNGTKKLNDREAYADCTAYSSGATSCRFPIDGGTAARLSMPGTMLDIVNSSGAVVADAVRVPELPRWEDTTGWTVAVELTSLSSVSNMDGISDNHALALYNSYNQGPNTIEDWMTKPSSGDSFIGGKNRTSAAYRYLNTQQVRYGATSAIVAKDHITQALQARAHLMDKKMTPMIRCGIEIADKLRDQYEGATLNSYNANEKGRTAGFGTTRLTFEHPTLGQTVLRGDEMMTSDKVDIQVMGDFVEMYYGQKGVRFAPGNLGPNNLFSRMASGTPGNGLTLVYQAQAYRLRCVWCRRPQLQTRILNLRAA